MHPVIRSRAILAIAVRASCLDSAVPRLSHVAGFGAAAQQQGESAVRRRPCGGIQGHMRGKMVPPISKDITVISHWNDYD